MQVEIVHGPGNSAARVALAGGESCTAEAGAMIAMSGDMTVTTTTHAKGSGSVLKAMKRVLSGESFFLNHFTAAGGGGELYLASSLAGDMLSLSLGKERLIVAGGGYVASEQGISIDMGWQGFRSLLSGENLFWLNVQGPGTVVLSSFGAIYPVDVDGEYIVDTGHIVAFPETLGFTLSKAGKSWMSSILGGEGLVCRFKGRGRLWCQSHNPSGFGRILGPQLRPR